MKYIHPNQGSFDGSVHYLVQNEGYIPQFQTNCNISKDPVREFFSHPETSKFFLDIDEKNTSNKNDILSLKDVWDMERKNTQS